MDTILTTIDFENNNWNVSANNLTESTILLDVKVLHKKFAPFNNLKTLKIKYSITENNSIVYQKEYPNDNIVKFIKTNQDTIITDMFNLNYDVSYKLHLFAENNHNIIEHIETFLIPKPLSPFTNWVWSIDHWKPPFPVPDDENLYVWSNSSGNWEVSEEEI